MKFTIEFEPQKSPSQVGELLRSAFFEERLREHSYRSFLGSEHEHVRYEHREKGGVDSVDWKPEVQPLPELPVDSYWNEPYWTRGLLKFPEGTIECRWYYDGDPCLAFIFPDGRWLVNDDCKKSHNWRLYASEKEYGCGD